MYYSKLILIHASLSVLAKKKSESIHGDQRTSGALQARLIGVPWFDRVVYVARPVELVCCDHLDVPKSPI